MANYKQCEKCGRDESKCPFTNESDNSNCQKYEKPIDNSRFFSHFWSYKGRICRRQFLVTILLGYIIAQLFMFLFGIIAAASGGDIGSDYFLAISIMIAYLPFLYLIIVAALKRGNDIGEDKQYCYSFIGFLVCLIIRLFTMDELDISFYILLGGVGFNFLALFIDGEEDVNLSGTKPLQPYDEQISWQEDENDTDD